MNRIMDMVTLGVTHTSEKFMRMHHDTISRQRGKPGMAGINPIRAGIWE